VWLFTVDGLISVTRSRLEPSKVQVRARSRETIERVADRVDQFMDGHPEVIETPEADYRYRIIIEPDEWKALAVKLADEVTYPNFKSEAARQHGHDAPYVKALHRIWETGTSLDDGGKRQQIPALVEAEFALPDPRLPVCECRFADGGRLEFSLNEQKVLYSTVMDGREPFGVTPNNRDDRPKWARMRIHSTPWGASFSGILITDPVVIAIVWEGAASIWDNTFEPRKIDVARYQGAGR
jgi:hypothetical protein